MILGIEVECLLSETAFDNDSPLSKSPQGSYHHPNKIKTIKYWETQSDGSLRVTDDYFNKTIEITSIPFKDTEIDLVIDDFKKIFGEGELHEFMQFNNSCGMHIHFTPDTKVMDKYTYPSVAEFLRNKAIKMFNTLCGEDSVEMIQHYDRSYAPKWTTFPKEMLMSPSQRGDINYNGYRDGKGYEWRSPHLLGVTTWEQFEKYIKGYIEILKSIETEKIESLPIEIITEVPLTARYSRPRTRRWGRTRYRTVNVIPMTSKIVCPLLRKSEVVLEIPTEEELECVI